MATMTRRSIPAQINPRFKKADPTPVAKAETPKEQDSVDTNIYVPLIKAIKDEQIVTGVVLQPDTTDAHGDTMSAAVVRKAAHKFLDNYNKATKLGLQHSNFAKQFQLLESYVTPHGITLNGTLIKEGSWVIVVKVLDAKIWAKVKKGEITGFSIGGKATVKKKKG